MTGDASAYSYEILLQRTRPFGFYQKRLFFITTVLQSFCWSIILYLEILDQHSWFEEPYYVIENFIGFQNTNVTNNTSPKTVVQNLYRNNTESISGKWTIPKWMTDKSAIWSYEYVWLGQAGGVIVGALLGGFFGDLVGRKVITFLMYGGMALAHGATALSEDWSNFFIFRSLTGLFSGGFMVASSVLTVEYMGQGWRDVSVCACLWTFGVLLVSLASWLTQHWRYLAIVTAATSLPFMGTYFIYPESFRWYGCRERFSESEAAIREIASCNTSAIPDLTTICDRARLAVLNTMHKRTHTFADLFNTKLKFKHTFAAMFCWFVSCAVYRCLLERTSGVTGNTYVDICLSFTADLPVIYSAVIINKCIGRRWCLFLYGTSAGFALMCIIVLHITNNLDEDQQMVTSISVFGKLGVSASIALSALITIETYPTAIRCMGLAVGLMSGVSGCTVGRELYAVLTKNVHYTLPYIGYGILMSCVGFTALLFVETHNKPLPDLLPSRHRMIGMKEVTRHTNAWNEQK